MFDGGEGNDFGSSYRKSERIEGSRNRDSTAFVSFAWFAVHDLFLSLFLAGIVFVIPHPL